MEQKNKNEKNIDLILKDYAAAAGEMGSDKKRHLSRLYREKRSEKRIGVACSSPKMKRLMPICVSAVLFFAIIIAVSMIDNGNYLVDYKDGSISGSVGTGSSSNKGSVFDSISSWLDSLKGEKQPGGNEGNEGSTGDVGVTGDKGDKGDKGNVGDKPNGGNSSGIIAGDPTLVFESAIPLGDPAHEFFKGLLTPTTKCRLISVKSVMEVYKADVDAYSAVLLPEEGAVEVFRMFNVVKGEPFGDYAFFDKYEDYKTAENEFDMNGITAIYSTEEINGMLVYYIYIDLGSVDCYVDLFAGVDCGIEEVMTKMFG